jgi:hypothetical protein
MTAVRTLLLQALRRPVCIASFSLEEWDLLIRQAHHAELLARICVLLQEQNLLHDAPQQAVRRLESARTVALGHKRDIRWAVNSIRDALVAQIEAPIVLLKGAAYVMTELPPARGRIFGDVDIMVPKDALGCAEQTLRVHGWVTAHLDPYDERYYRQWAHELPPLRHITRHTVLDVHHTILPPTARMRPDPEKLFEAARLVDGHYALRVLAPHDMVLHSATHLFQEGEFENGLRDLVDLDDLLRYFGRKESFWPALVERAKEMDLIRPLYYALRYTHRILGTPVPEEIRERNQLPRPRGFVSLLMDAAFTRALAPDHPSCDTALTKPARFFLYVRSHYLRMPLLRKAFKRRFDPSGQH